MDDPLESDNGFVGRGQFLGWAVEERLEGDWGENRLVVWSCWFGFKSVDGWLDRRERDEIREVNPGRSQDLGFDDVDFEWWNQGIDFDADDNIAMTWLGWNGEGEWFVGGKVGFNGWDGERLHVEVRVKDGGRGKVGFCDGGWVKTRPAL